MKQLPWSTRIRAVRAAQGWSQAELAARLTARRREMVGESAKLIRDTQVSRWESDDGEPENLVKAIIMEMEKRA